MDFLELRRTVDGIIGRLDHRNLNNLFDNPTAENVASGSPGGRYRKAFRRTLSSRG